MPACRQQVWQRGWGSQDWGVEVKLCTSEGTTQGSSGLMSLLKEYRDSELHSVKRAKRALGLGHLKPYQF